MTAWFDRLQGLLTRELAPTPRKLRTALRVATIGMVGAGLIASCHVINELGAYIVWLLVGAGPMMAPRRAIEFLIAEAIALAASVVLSGILVETPWLILPFLSVVMALMTYFGAQRNLGAPLLLIQVVCLNIFYGVVFAPDAIGWNAAGAFGGSVIAFGTIVAFDNWLWPDPGEAILLESLGAAVAHDRTRLLAAARYFLDRDDVPRPRLPPPTSDLPAHMALLSRVAAEGVSEHRRAILLAAITRVARIGLEIDRLTIAVLQTVPNQIRALTRPEIEAAVAAIAAVLDEIAHELPTHVPVGVDSPPSISRIRAGAGMDALTARVIEVRPSYIATASSAELENFAAFTDSLATLTRHIERLLDEPPMPPGAAPMGNPMPAPGGAQDAATLRYAVKVGACVAIGYALGLVTQRVDLSTILTTVLITALPTYGAALRKMILRIIGALLGGVVSLVAIIVVTPNFASLPSYMMAFFVVFFVSAYSSLSSGRIAYAGKQIGVTFALVFAGLSPALDVYEPLWRIWGILLGTLVVAFIAFLLWPEYAGDSLLPRLREVIRGALALMPGRAGTGMEEQIQRSNAQTMRVLAEILEVADDAQVEGRSSQVNHNAIIEAAGGLRRIANRLASISSARIDTPVPQLDAETEAARTAVVHGIHERLQSWLDFFSRNDCLNAAEHAFALAATPAKIAAPLGEFGTRIEEREFARIDSWTLDQRRALLAELHSLRRLEDLIQDLDRWFPRIPGGAPQPSS